MSLAIKTGFILCAGLGTRMMPLTKDKPKALVDVLGKTLLARLHDHLKALGVNRIIVNVHHHKDVMLAYLKTHFPDVIISVEDELLETGGGLIKAKHLLGDAPFLVVDCDSLGEQGSDLPLKQWISNYDSSMDVFLLLARKEKCVGFEGKGDYFCDENQKLNYRGDHDSAPFVASGARIVHPRNLAGEVLEKFSSKRLWDKAEKKGSLYGFVADQVLFHVGTPEGLRDTNDRLNESF